MLYDPFETDAQQVIDQLSALRALYDQLFEDAEWSVLDGPQWWDRYDHALGVIVSVFAFYGVDFYKFVKTTTHK